MRRKRIDLNKIIAIFDIKENTTLHKAASHLLFGLFMVGLLLITIITNLLLYGAIAIPLTYITCLLWPYPFSWGLALAITAIIYICKVISARLAE